MSAPKDKTGKDIVVGDFLVYVMPYSGQSFSSHVAKVVSIGADGTLSGIKRPTSNSNLRLASRVLSSDELGHLARTYDPNININNQQPQSLRDAKDYIKVSASGGAPSGRRRKTKKSERRARKTRRSRK